MLEKTTHGNILAFMCNMTAKQSEEQHVAKYEQQKEITQ